MEPNATNAQNVLTACSNGLPSSPGIKPCSSCSMWGDHGAGVEQCYYDWKQEEQDREEGEDET